MRRADEGHKFVRASVRLMQLISSCIVCSYAEDGEEVVLVDRAGRAIPSVGVTDGDGAAVAAVELRDQSGRVTQCCS